jgi:HEAT repeat protein
MIAFCTRCWAEINAADKHCSGCGVDLSIDARSYEEKLIAALRHPLPEARVRICWLIGENQVTRAVPLLIELVESDQDLFVRRAAISALGTLRDARALPVLTAVSQAPNRFLGLPAAKSIERIEVRQVSSR